MDENPPQSPQGADEVVTFILGVALPVLSSGILINEVMRVTVGPLIPMDAVLSIPNRRFLGTAIVGLGFAVCLSVALDRSASPRDKRFFRGFLLVNLALAAAWTGFWLWCR